MSLTLLDWRRRVALLYADVRGEPDPAAAHAHWRTTRDDLLRDHPDSPVPPPRARLPGRPDRTTTTRRLRFDSPSTPRGPPGTWGPHRHRRDRPVRPHRLRPPPGGGDLDVWWLASYGGGLFVPVKDASAGSPPTGAGATCSTPRRAPISAGDDGHLDPRLQLRLQPVLRLRPRAGPARWPRPATPSAARCWPESSCRDMPGGAGRCARGRPLPPGACSPGSARSRQRSARSARAGARGREQGTRRPAP